MRYNDARGWGVIPNDVLKKSYLTSKFMNCHLLQNSLVLATAHVRRRSISRNSNRQVI